MRANLCVSTAVSPNLSPGASPASSGSNSLAVPTSPGELRPRPSLPWLLRLGGGAAPPLGPRAPILRASQAGPPLGPFPRGLTGLPQRRKICLLSGLRASMGRWAWPRVRMGARWWERAVTRAPCPERPRREGTSELTAKASTWATICILTASPS